MHFNVIFEKGSKVVSREVLQISSCWISRSYCIKQWCGTPKSGWKNPNSKAHVTETFWCFTVVCKLFSEETLLQCLQAARWITKRVKKVIALSSPSQFFLEVPMSHSCSRFQPLVQTGQISTNCSFAPFALARHIQAAQKNSSTCGSNGADLSGSRAVTSIWEQYDLPSAQLHPETDISPQPTSFSPDPRDQNILIDKKNEDAFSSQHTCFVQLCGHTAQKVKRLTKYFLRTCLKKTVIIWWPILLSEDLIYVFQTRETRRYCQHQ